jgi:hypothetical protein
MVYFMNYVRFAIISFLIFICAHVYAQQWSQSQDLTIVKDTYFKVLGKWQGDYRMARVGTNFVELLTFRDDLTIRWGRVVDLVQEEPIVHDVFEGADKFYVLYSIERQDSIQLVLSRYNMTGALISAMIVKTVPSEAGRPAYEPLLSKNNEWLTLTFMAIDDLFEVVIVNLERLQKVREDVYDLSSFQLQGRSPYVHITHTGRIFIFVEYFEMINNTPRQFMTVLQVFLDDRPTQTKEVDFGNFIVETPFFLTDPEEDRVYIFGIFRDFRVGAGMGVYQKTIYTDFEQDPKSGTFPLNADVQAQYNKKLRSPLQGIPGLRLVEVNKEDDRSFTVFSEIRFDIPKESGVRSLRGEQDMDHYYDEIFVMSVNADGSPGYQLLLEKEQFSNNDAAVRSSFFIHKIGSDYHLIFNESIRRNAKVKSYIVQPDGKFTKSYLLEERRHTYFPYISRAMNIGENEILIPSKRNRKANLLRLKMD